MRGRQAWGSMVATQKGKITYHKGRRTTAGRVWYRLGRWHKVPPVILLGWQTACSRLSTNTQAGWVQAQSWQALPHAWPVPVQAGINSNKLGRGSGTGWVVSSAWQGITSAAIRLHWQVPQSQKVAQGGVARCSRRSWSGRL